jgi:hypothetical protein
MLKDNNLEVGFTLSLSGFKYLLRHLTRFHNVRRVDTPRSVTFPSGHVSSIFSLHIVGYTLGL